MFDVLFEWWEGSWSQRWQATLLVVVFLSSLLAIEFSRQGFLPASLNIPTNHFYAVKIAFDLLLTLEIFGLIFNLASSVANSMGKQFEIFSLILLRKSFTEFVRFEEPIAWTHVQDSVQFIISDALGAVVIFGLLSVFYNLQKHRKITNDIQKQASFIVAKKLAALLLLAIFIAVGINDAGRWLSGGETYNFFNVFYTVLVFGDILLVLISLRYNSTYSIVFRNAGFAVATVLIRLALTAPSFANVLLGVTAIVMSIGLTYIYNRFSLFPPHSDITHPLKDFAETFDEE